MLVAAPGHGATLYRPDHGDPMLEPWRWRTFQELSGLGAQCMAEAGDGALWFGTAEAFWRYDGFAWEEHRSELISGGNPETLCPGPDGSLYAGGRWGIVAYRDGTWSRQFPADSSMFVAVRKLFVARDGTLWAATSRGALCRRDGRWFLLTDPATAAEARTRTFQPAVEIMAMPDAVSNEPRPGSPPAGRGDLVDIAEDRDGRIWMATVGGEILCLVLAAAVAELDQRAAGGISGTWTLHNEMDGMVCGRNPSILPVRDGSVWVVYGTVSGHANVFQDGAWRAIDLTAAGVPGNCRHPLQTADGTIWLSSRYAVSAWRAGAWRTYGKPEVPIPSAQNLLLQSKDGALWIAGPGTEIQRVDYETTRWLTLNDLVFQWESPTGSRWFLHRSGRVVVHEGEDWTSFGPEDGVIDTPVALLGTRTGEVWAAGSQGTTAATARFDGSQWTRFIHHDLAWGVEWRGVLESSDGSVWFAAAVDTSGPREHRAGILQYKEGAWRHHHQPGRAPPESGDSDPTLLLPATQRPEPIGKFLCLGESPDGRIWAGRNLLIVRDESTWRVFQPPPAMPPATIIETMFTAPGSGLWIGSRQFGAFVFDGSAWRRHQGKGSLVANSVRSIAQTGDGSIWAATDRDVSRFDGTSWTADLLPASMHITQEAGGSLKGTASGRLWINLFAPDWTRRAWSKAARIDPATCEFRTFAHSPAGPAPETTITSGTTEVAQPGNLSVLWAGAARWRSEADARLQYSFRLDDTSWSPFAHETGHAFFTLPHGPHRIEVRARDRDFNVDPTPAVLEFVVLPPVWRQAWFLILVTLLGASAAAQSFRFVLERSRLRRTNRVLAEEIAVRRRTEDALRVGEANLTEAQQLAHLGSWTMDFARDHLEWSAEVYRIFEVDPAQFTVNYEAFLLRVHPEDRPMVDRTCREFARDPHPFDIEHRIITPAGGVKFVNLRCRAVHASDGRLLHFLGTVQDITDRKLAEQRIWKLNRTYAVLSDINALIVREREPAAILGRSCRIAVDTGGFAFAWTGLADRGDGRMTLAAHAGGSTALVDCVRATLAGPGEPRPRASHRSEICNDLAAEPESPLRDAALAEGYRSMVSLPLAVSGRDAGEFALYAAEAGFFDENEIHLLEELAQDIAFALDVCEREQERQRTVGQLRASEERFRELAETIEDVFWITDPAKGRMLYVSPAYERIWGRPRRDLYDNPRSWLDAVHPEDRERVAFAVRTRQAQGTYDEEYRITRPDGVVRWIRDRAFPVRGFAGTIERILGVARDITAGRELEARLRQSQKLEAIGQLAGGVAHDFNNILAAITMQVELAELTEHLPAAAAEELQEIRAAASRAANLTRQLLLFSRRQALQTHDVDLNEIVGNLARMLQRIIGEDIHLQLAPHPAPLVTHADPGMLDQVLLNLAVNARDAMPSGGQLTIKTGDQLLDDASARHIPDVSPGRHVWLSVTDTGCGIPPEVLPRIFEPFFTTKEPGRGTGLGLATVFGIVKQHRGWITVDSEVGRGTTFRVFLPASANKPSEDTSGPGTTRAPGGTETVLLVEDDPSVRATTRMFLVRHGYRVLEATSGARALAVWEAHRDAISVLLTDMVMPDHVGGHELARRLRSDCPQLKVIFTSGYSAAFSGRQVEIGPDETFLQKPYPPEDLLAALRRSLDDGRA